MTYKPRTEVGTPLDSAIEEMDVVALEYPERKSYVELVRDSLIRVRDQHSEGVLAAEAASQQLFHLYFHNQAQSQELGSMPHVLRVVGDDFGWQLGVDGDLLWDMYQQSLKLHERRAQ